MLEVVKGGKEPHSQLEKLLAKKFGRMPNVVVDGDHADMLVPRENILESGKAVRWLNDCITTMERQPNSANDPLLDSLKGLWVVFRDCALFAQYMLNFREANMDKKYKGLDVMIRFRQSPVDKTQLMMEVGSAMRKDKAAPPPEDDDDE